MTKKESNNHHPGIKTKLTAGQKAADFVTTWVGSWYFIGLLILVMIVWMIINLFMLVYRWDPYPFILLNFVLSTLAALQAPMILMSNKRQAERDRVQAGYDYQVNRKAEREIQAVQRDLDEIKKLIKNKK